MSRAIPLAADPGGFAQVGCPMAPPSAFPAPRLSLSRVSPTIYEVGFRFTTCEDESRWILGFFSAVSFSWHS